MICKKYVKYESKYAKCHPLGRNFFHLKLFCFQPNIFVLFKYLTSKNFSHLIVVCCHRKKFNLNQTENNSDHVEKKISEMSFSFAKKISFQYLSTSFHLKNISLDKAPSEATFRGTEFLSYDLGQTGGEPIVSAQDAISLYFRTRQPNGLLFYTGMRQKKRIFYRNKIS